MAGKPTRDEIKGVTKQSTGTIKDKVGEWTRDPDLEAEGEVERTEGEIQETFGKAKREIGDKLEETGERLKK